MASPTQPPNIYRRFSRPSTDQINASREMRTQEVAGTKERVNWDLVVGVPGKFKVDHLHSVRPILFSKFYNFFTFILEANSDYPRELIMRKGNSPNSRNGLDRGVWVPGAFKLDHLHPVKPILFSKFYNFFTFILEANSHYPRGLIMRKEKSPNSRNGLHRGVWVPGGHRGNFIVYIL